MRLSGKAVLSTLDSIAQRRHRSELSSVNVNFVVPFALGNRHELAEPLGS
jgi:hypothetical protein